jgi:geranylgeranyl reductase family protein
MITDYYDVIIVGGGPSGSTAGYILAKEGLNVLILDKHKFPREKVCGGLISYKTLKLVCRIFGMSERFFGNNISNYTSKETIVCYEDEILIEDRLRKPFYFVDRKEYDHYLLEKVKEEGVKVFEGVKIQQVNAKKGKVFDNKGNEYRADFIIGADGVNSAVRKCFPDKLFDRTKWNENLAITLKASIPNKKENDEFPTIFHFGLVRWGYSWVFPNEHNVNFGVTGLSSNRGSFEYALSKELELFNIDRKGINISTYSIPYGYYIKYPVHEKVLVVGDAGGYTDPLFGEGLFYAHRTAEMAALSIISHLNSHETVETIYPKLMKKHVYPELNYVRRIRNFIFGLLDYSPKALNRFIVKQTYKTFLELAQGKKIYTIFGRGKYQYDPIDI